MRLPKEQVHTFVAATARRWGFRSRVTLYNDTGERVHVGVEVRDAAGSPLGGAPVLEALATGQSILYEVDQLCARLGLATPSSSEYVFRFHLVPDRWLHSQGPVETAHEEVLRLITAQDHYVEHYDPTTMFSSGVLYQIPPMNHPVLALRGSLVMQSPKVFLSEERNTVVQVLYPCGDPERRDTGRLWAALRRPSGERILAWPLEVPAHGVAYLDVKETLARHGISWQEAADRHGFLFLEAFSNTHSFVPLTFNLNEARRTFDMEHSLPPTYYGSAIAGPRRGQIVQAWMATFQNAPPQPPAT